MLAYAVVIFMTALAFYGLIGFDQAQFDARLLRDSYIQQILMFSIQQSGLSALLSILFAIPIARTIHFMPQLPGRLVFLRLCLLSFIMPTLVLVTGLVALLGRSGYITPLLSEDWNLYGLNGILLAHIYLNMPLAVRVLSQQLGHIPDTGWRLAQQLKLSPWQSFLKVEWPAIKSSLLMLSAFIFVLCFNSFAVVLALGGGPGSTTLEVAIYQALKYDFNLSEALTLAWLQFALAGSIFLLMAKLGKLNWLSADTGHQRWLPTWPKYQQHAYRILYCLVWLLLLSPVLALLPTILSVNWETFNWITLFTSALRSLALALTSALLALLLTWYLLQPIRSTYRHQQEKFRVILQWLATHTLVAPAMVLSTGLYIYLLPRTDLDSSGIFWLITLNALLLIPFIFGQLKPRLIQFDQQYALLSENLKLTPKQRLYILWPFIRPALISSFSLAVLLALGDVAVFSIFGDSDWSTLPWLIYGYAGSYRMAEAALASLLLLLLCIALIYLFEHTPGGHFRDSGSRKSKVKNGSGK